MSESAPAGHEARSLLLAVSILMLVAAGVVAQPAAGARHGELRISAYLEKVEI